MSIRIVLCLAKDWHVYNRFDTMLRAGYMHQMMPFNFLSVLAGDFAGTIAQVGEGIG
ncbi:MAG: hypothetical protein ABI834_06390 [Ginsengibacter sp.]